MARHIGVQQQVDGESLYDEPLGSESAIRESWSEPASKLGLPLIAAIYQEGFYQGVRWNGPKLDQILDEISRLEGYWQSAGLSPDVLNDLAQRAGYIRVAIALARRCNGFVIIT